MAIDDDHHPIDDKTRRMRDLLSSFYAHDPSTVAASKSISLDVINTSSFDSEKYMDLLVKKSNLEGLLRKHVEMAAEIKNLDTDLQMLVYENYNKFVSATETIKRMKNNIVGMESNMEQLLEKIMSVQSKSDVVNTCLFAKREHIEKLHRTRNLLRKVQFIYDLPARLGKFIMVEAYGNAVKFYTGAMPIFKAYGDSSFHDCKKASEEAMDVVIRNLQEKIFSVSETTEARAEALVLLKQLDFPVDNIQAKLLERLEHFVVDLESEAREVETATSISDKPSIPGNSDTLGITPSETCKHKASIHEFAEAVRAHRVMFFYSEPQLIELSLNMFTKHFKTVEQRIQKKASSTDLLAMLRTIYGEVTMMDEVLPEGVLPRFSLEAAHGAIKQYVASTFSHLLNDIAEALLRAQTKSKEKTGEDHSLQLALASSKRAMIQGSMDALLDFRQLLDENLGLLVKLRKFIIDWVQEGFQEFFRSLHDHFLELSETNTSTRQHQGSIDGTQRDKVLAGLVLVLAQLSVFIEESAIQRITEEIAASFSGGGFRSNEDGPAFVPGEICRAFRSAGEKFLHLYVNIKTQKLSILLRKRFTAPNWTKHKEPRDVHMFVDLLLQEMEEIRAEVKQILSRGLNRKHRHSLSNGSNSSSRGNAIRDDKISPSNTQRARSQFLETHLALLFKQKMEIFTRLEYTQESVVSTIVKLFLKSLQEFVRMQTFNRSGFQQIQLDIQFLRAPLKETVEDEATIDFLLDEIIMSAAERCLDPISLEPAILDRLIQAKLSKRGEQSPTSS